MAARKAKVVERQNYKSGDVEVKEVKGRGNGLFAAVDLPANWRIPYSGKEIDEKKYESRVAASHIPATSTYAEYIIASGRKGVYIDGHPRFKVKNNANMVNEPPPGTTANMVMVMDKFTDGTKWPVFVTVRPVPAGEELFVKYGEGYVRKYKVGRRASKPAWLAKS